MAIEAALLVQLAAIKAQIDALTEQKNVIETALCDALVAAGKKSTSITLADTGDQIKGTLVAVQRVVYDEERLKKALGSKVWPKVVKEVLDKEKLEANIVAGVIDAVTVASCTEVKDNKPYVKISGSYSPQAAVSSAVSIVDDKGNTKPAAKRVKKPAKK